MAYAEREGAQMMYTEDEIAMLKGVFANNEPLLKLMRKVFLPPYDPNAPVGQVIDLWLAATDLKSLTPDAAYQLIMARNSIIMHIESRLNDLKFLASVTTKSQDEQKATDQANSTK